ncbi:MAG: type II toxin-antitoxin system prevent-host-death family antitoxin [Methylococcaceae bacterium]
MLKLHPQLITKNGKNEFVVLPFEEYCTLIELLADYQNLQNCRTAKNESKNNTLLDLDSVLADYQNLQDCRTAKNKSKNDTPLDLNSVIAQ